MRAMILEKPGRPLELRDLPDPVPGPGELRVPRPGLRGLPDGSACRRWGTAESETATNPGTRNHWANRMSWRGVDSFRVGERVGIPWLGWTCGRCDFCKSRQENLCEHARFTGYTIDGGYAEMTVANAHSASEFQKIPRC